MLFNTRNASVQQVRDELKACLSRNVYNGIISIKKIQPSGKPARVDLVIDTNVSSGIKRAFQAMATNRTPRFVRMTRSAGLLQPGIQWRTRAISMWRMDMWKAWRDRPQRARIAPPPMPKTYRDNLMTINVNGLKSKCMEVKHVLIEKEVSVCAMQETLMSPRAFQIHMPGYKSYVMHRKEGFRGQTLYVQSRLSSYEVGRVDGLYIHVKVAGLSGTTVPVHVIAVYLPSGGNFITERAARVRKLLKVTKKLLRADKDAPIIVLGDWNITPNALETLLLPAVSGMSVYKPKGSDLTRFPKRGKRSAIDHFVVSRGAMAILRRPRTHRDVAVSDHRPLIAQLREAVHIPVAEQPEAWVYDTDAIRKNGKDFVSSNRWEALTMDDPGNAHVVNNAANAFIRVADELNSTFDIKKRKGGAALKMPTSIQRALESRNEWAQKIVNLTLAGKEPTKRIEKRAH